MTVALQKSSQETLQRLVDQIERLESEIKDLTDDRADKYKECRSAGFDVKIVRKIIRLRKQDKTEREEEEAVMSVYLSALGMLSDTPLGQWAVETKQKEMARA